MTRATRATAIWELVNAAHTLADDLSLNYDQPLAESAMTHLRAAMEALALIASQDDEARKEPA